MAGEELHERGREGVRRAKEWLEFTTRAEVPWTVLNPAIVNKLEFGWADGGTYSFDLAGHLTSGEVDGQMFFGEVKYYKRAEKQADQYEEFLAKTFRALLTDPARCDRFLWITWAPFSASIWDDLTDVNRIRKAVASHSAKVLGEEDVEWTEVDEGVALDLAERVWIIVLSEPEETHLRMLEDHYELIKGKVARAKIAGP